MKRVLYGVSPIGLGHATRASAVAEELRRIGAEVLFASGGNAADYLKLSGFATEDIVRVPVPTVVRGEMKRAAFWYLRYWRGYRRSKAAMEGLISEFKPDLVVGDEEFSSVVIAMERGIKHALVTDELELGFARTAAARAIESRVSRWYSGVLGAASTVIIPEFGEDFGSRKHVGPIVRKLTRTKDQVFHDYAFPAGEQMVLLSLSGSGIGEHLLAKAVRGIRELKSAGVFLAISGNRGRRTTGDGVFDLGVVSNNQDLVAAADLVISTAGKSTIDEAVSAGTPIVALPIKNHAEQERNAAALGYRPSDVGRLHELVSEKIGRREAPRDFQGAEKASSLLVSML